MSSTSVRYLALLRGINVGGNSQVAMSRLKIVFSDLGFTNVSTYINSGNVLFSSSQKDIKQLVIDIESALVKNFGFNIRVVVRTAINIQALVKFIPAEWENNATDRTDILFLWDDFDQPTTLGLIQTQPVVDTLLYCPGAIIWHLDRSHLNQSGMRKFIGTSVYKNMTARNVNTVRKLAQLLD